MANSIEFAPVYYDSGAAGEFAYKDYQQKVAMTKDITDSITRSAESINSRIVDAQIATANAIHNNTQEMIGAFNSGFSNVSRQVGTMGANMSMSFAALNEAIQASSQAICDRLDTISDILNNPSLTKTRELYRRAAVSYNKGFYEEARNDLLEALASNKTDYISWFLLGKTYLFGASEFSNVIDLDAAVDAMKNAVKFITPDARKQEDARIMASEMCFFLGLAQQTKALDSLHAKNKADCQSYLEQAGNSYGQSFDYSPQMLEARYNRARCKALLGDVPGALADLEKLVLADRNYCIKVYADKDFSNITEQFAALIKKLKSAAFIAAKKDYDHIKNLMQEITSLGGKVKVTVPTAFTEATPFFDLLGYAKDFKQNISILEKTIINIKRAKYIKCITTSGRHTVGLKADGTVVATGENRLDQCNVSDWRDIVAVAAGDYHTVGLIADGTVVATGNNGDGQCNVSGWLDIVAVAAGWSHTVGLKADGKVVATGSNGDGQCNVREWRNIVAVYTSEHHTIGLKTDGTVVTTGKNGDGKCNVSGWRDIVAVTSCSGNPVGLKADGTVVATGSGDNFRSWRDIVAVSGSFCHAVGLKADGTVVATGRNGDGQCNVSTWSDIVAVTSGGGKTVGGGNTVGLKADGTVVATGQDGQFNVSAWHDIIAITSGRVNTVGLKADGTVVATGENDNGQCNVSGWRNIGPVSEEQILKWKQAREEEKRRNEEAAKKAEAEYKERKAKEDEEQRLKGEQQKQWKAQGLCYYCGGKLGLFTKKCKSCGLEN